MTSTAGPSPSALRARPVVVMNCLRDLMQILAKHPNPEEVANVALQAAKNYAPGHSLTRTSLTRDSDQVPTRPCGCEGWEGGHLMLQRPPAKTASYLELSHMLPVSQEDQHDCESDLGEDSDPRIGPRARDEAEGPMGFPVEEVGTPQSQVNPHRARWADEDMEEDDVNDGRWALPDRTRPKCLWGACTISVMNIPARYTQARLLEEWDPEQDRFNYLHLPWCAKLQHNAGFVFLNFWCPEDALAFQKKVQGTYLANHGRNKFLNVSVASAQGVAANLQKYLARNLAKLNYTDYGKDLIPALFDRGGHRLSSKAVLRSQKRASMHFRPVVA
ncbi:unnamed protein product [Polarella glacialis]|uniref:Mei2-like C-terminal RNA recognition motif domain-containing protein n=1 Tax=Polarella glacialis TaxID=89957 RepID=A0A813DTZ7_POLGL|nr:unnamed protein product [Polarella glacialis]CAE8696303.1 unnamed protein product [Polarella glacialis]